MPITITEVLLAFPNTAPFADEVTGTPPEIFDIERDLSGKSWISVDATTCSRHPEALLMMDQKPLAYFLPAFLVAAIQQPRSAAAESLVYFVCGCAFDRLIPSLGPAQHKAVVDTVEAILNSDDGFYAEQTEAFLRRAEQSSI